MIASSRSVRHTLAELAGLFLKLGSTAFGGPAAHVALMEAEVAHHRSTAPKPANARPPPAI